MKNKEQQELCQSMDNFRKVQSPEAFQDVLTGLFKSPLVFPQGKGDNKGQFMLAQKENQTVLLAFSDVEEAKKGNLGDVEYTTLTIEEYAQVMAGVNANGMIINIFNESSCILNKNFFVDVVLPSFKENRIMPGLRSTATGEYIQITKMPFSIGRSEQADLTIADNTVNEFHGLLIEREGKYYVVDRDSLNGTYVNGRKVEKEQQIEFDDVIEFCDAEYEFISLGLAQRKAVTKSVYGPDINMVANAMFFLQNNIIVKEFMTNGEAFIGELSNGDTKEAYRKYFLVALETTCKIKEKELNIEESDTVIEQRNAMLGRGVTIFKKDDYGFTRIQQENGFIYQVDFPEILSIPGLARRIYLVFKENGDKAAYVVRIMQEKVFLVKVGMDDSETNCGEAPATAEEELKKVLELGV